MPKSFTLREPTKLSNTTAPLGLNEFGHPMFQCARLLAGSVDLYRKSDEKIIRPRFCYLSQSIRTVRKVTIKEIVSLIYGEEGIDVEAFVRSLRTYGARNRKFWEELSAELCHLLNSIHEDRHIDSFLYLYRVHERVSVALPLIYAHSEIDFGKALEFIKSISSEERDGELSVFKLFVSKYFSSNDLYRDLMVDVDFSIDGPDWGKIALAEVKSALGLDNEKNANKFAIDEGAGVVSFRFIHFPIFLVSFRNRLFHYTNSQRNFDLDRLGGADGVCRAVVPSMLYCLSQVVSEIVRRQTPG
jgi:hypothetical protein